jgi:hypothetical protein
MGQIRRPIYSTTDPKTGEKVRHQSKIWWVRYYRNGRRHEESSGSTKKGEAERLLRMREGDVAKGLPVTAKIGQLRFGDAAADVVTDYRVNGKRSLADVERRIKLHLEPYFGGRRMAAITTADVRAYTAHRQDAGATNATINRELAILKRAYRLAAQAGMVLNRPHIPMLDEDNVRGGFFERDAFEDVRDGLPEHLRGVVTLAYHTGWRVQSEILPLTWGQVDRKAKTVRLEPGSTKNRKGRTLPYGLLPELEEVIERQWAEHQRLAAEGQVGPVGVPPRRGADARLSQGVGVCLRCGRRSWKTPPRLPPHRRAQPDARRRARHRRHADYRPQDALRVRPLQHHLRDRPARRARQAGRERKGKEREVWPCA